MADPTDILTTIDLLADLAADVQATRGWVARIHAGHELGERERAAVARHLSGVRDGAAAALHGARLLGLAPEDSAKPAGES